MALYPLQDALFRNWLERFVTGCNAHAATLKLSPGELAQIQAESDAFAVGISDAITARAALASKVVEKNDARDAARATVSEWNKRFRTTVGVTDAILRDLQLPVYGEPTSRTPITPTDLIANAKSSGSVTFKFNRSGNPQYTTFVFEAAETALGPWQYVGSTTNTRVTFNGFVPGQQLLVRVYARIKGLNSQPSEPVYLYAPGSPQILQIAA